MRRLAVIGHPVSHSLSPAIHNAAFEELGLAGEWRYEALDLTPEAFAAGVRALPAEGFVGANATIPHKLAALELADEASEAATRIGAANTLSFAPERIRADNTDAEGFLAAMGSPPAGRRALVLGAGGSARAVVWALVEAGAEVSIWNRTQPKAEELADRFGARALGTGDAAPESDFDLIVNTTSVGMPAPGDASTLSPTEETRPENATTFNQLPITADSFHDRQIVVDLVYRVGGTELLRIARSRGAAVVDGLEVLVRQGAASFRIWTGLEPPIEAMRRAATLQERQT